MNARMMAIRCLIVALSGGMTLAAVGCGDGTTQPPDPVRFGLKIELFNHAPEAVKNTNVYIKGSVTDANGVRLKDVLVTFVVVPDSIGNVTPMAKTQPDSGNGFDLDVTFNGLKLGVAWIRGNVPGGLDAGATTDSVRVQVTGPINE